MKVVHPEGFEPPTPGSEDQCSIQLSYGCTSSQKPCGYRSCYCKFFRYWSFGAIFSHKICSLRSLLMLWAPIIFQRKMRVLKIYSSFVEGFPGEIFVGIKKVAGFSARRLFCLVWKNFISWFSFYFGDYSMLLRLEMQ